MGFLPRCQMESDNVTFMDNAHADCYWQSVIMDSFLYPYFND